MSTEASQDPQALARQRDERRKTKHRGISYRETAGGRTYYVYWGSKYLRAGGTLESALALQSDLRSRQSRGEHVVLASKRSFGEFAEEWWACEDERLRPRYRDEKDVRRIIDRELLPAWGERRIGSIDGQDVFALDVALQKRGLSESTRSNYLKPARRIFDFAVFQRAIPASPFKLAPRASLPSCGQRREHFEWSSEQVDTFIRVAHERDERPEAKRGYGDQIELMISCGLRIGEASGLKFSDIDREGLTIAVERQWTKRGQLVEYVKTTASRRRVPITAELLGKLDFRQSFLGLADEDLIFADERGGTPLSHSNFTRRGWNRVVEQTGLPLKEGTRLTPHDSRHACASQLADLDLDSDDLASVLGHSSSKITESTYVHAFNREAREQRVRAAMSRAQNGGTS
jgi:integrase